MKDVAVADTIRYVGVDDKTIDIFESQYPVPNGVSYNSYVILDEKVAVMDTVDRRATEEWLANLERELNGRTPDYLVVHHMEPDHAANIQLLAEKYPQMQIVGNAKTFAMIRRFFTFDLEGRTVEVKEGSTLNLGSHTLTFVLAPMVHWPEAMVSYESSEKVLFSADGFGKFGTLDTEEDWACEARRYYFNIVGKYGASVQALLKKAAGLDIAMICPLHGPILKENLGYYINLYDIWSSYRPETEGVFLAYASIHGNTAKAALALKEMLERRGVTVAAADVCRTDVAECVEDAFRYSKMVCCAASYDGGLFLPMEDFLHHLKAKTYQNRKVALVENGTWAPSALRVMKELFSAMKNVEICDKTREALAKENLDVVLNLTSSGSKFSEDLRLAHFPVCKPEMCSYDPGTLNWANSYVFLNTPQFLERLGKLAIDLDIKPEIEVFDGGHMQSVEHYVKIGALKQPVHYQFVLGVTGAMPGNMDSLNYLLPKMLPGSTWSITGIGRSHLPCLLLGLANGCDGLRVGLEDNIYLEKGVLATNTQLVERAVRLSVQAGREIATAADAREILGLTKHVDF